MSDSYAFPKLRWPLDITIQELQGKSVLVLTCPAGFSSQPLALIPEVAPILKEFTGDRSREALLVEFADYGLTPELLQDLLQLLDQNLFLESPAFFKARDEIKNAYQATPIREPYLAGVSYAAEESVLKKQLHAYIKSGSALTPASGTLAGIVAPHIDYRRGGGSYGKAYAHLKQHTHDLYIIMGTSHQYSPHLFHLSRKHFETPLGTLPCATTFVSKVAALYGEERAFADEYLHRREHSVELQTPFLQLSHAGSAIAPILVGSFYDMLRQGKYPSEFEVYERFVESLTKVVADEMAAGTRVLPIASVDMAHIGTFFGDTEKLTPERLAEIEVRDAAYIAAISARDKAALFAHVAEDLDARRICGFPSMYLLLDLYDRLGISYTATTYEYQQAVDPQTDCAVTFAAMGLYVP